MDPAVSLDLSVLLALTAKRGTKGQMVKLGPKVIVALQVNLGHKVLKVLWDHLVSLVFLVTLENPENLVLKDPRASLVNADLLVHLVLWVLLVQLVQSAPVVNRVTRDLKEPWVSVVPQVLQVQLEPLVSVVLLVLLVLVALMAPRAKLVPSVLVERKGIRALLVLMVFQVSRVPVVNAVLKVQLVPSV